MFLKTKQHVFAKVLMLSLMLKLIFALNVKLMKFWMIIIINVYAKLDSQKLTEFAQFLVKTMKFLIPKQTNVHAKMVLF